MKLPFARLPWLVCSAALSLTACNTAQVTQPAQLDAGPPCSEKAPLASCEAGAPAASPAGSCTGGVVVTASGLDGSSTVPPGDFAPGCVLTFFVDDHAGGCLDSPTCTCVPGGAAPDAGADAGGDGGGAVTTGTWSCVR